MSSKRSANFRYTPLVCVRAVLQSLAIALIGCILLLGCTTPTQDARQPGETVVEIELLAFSGRENLRWILTDLEEQQLTLMTRDLPPGPPPPEPPGLGYRGFLVTTSGEQGGFAQTITIYRGVRIGEASVRGDVRRDDVGLEQWLIDMARGRGHGELLTALGL